MIGKQIFFDASGTRTRWTNRLFLLGYLVLFALIAIFCTTVIYLPRPEPLGLSVAKSRLRPTVSQSPGGGKPRRSDEVAGPRPGTTERADKPIRVGFYVPWDENSGASLLRHVDQMDWVVAASITVTGRRHQLRIPLDPRLDAALASARTPVALLPMIRNAIEDDWDGDGAAALLAAPRTRAALLARVEAYLHARGASGAVFDFEEMPRASYVDYLRLIQEAHVRFAAQGWQVVVAMPADASDWQLEVLSQAADKLIFKTFNEPANDDRAGPIASQYWFADRLAFARAHVAPHKLIVAIGNFANDRGAEGASEEIGVEDAWLTARESQAPVRFDPVSGNPGLAYEDGDTVHQIWMLDAVTAWNQARAAYLSGIAGIAVWRLGTEDSAVWAVLANLGRTSPPNLARLESRSNVDVRGSGELLRIEAAPADGRRNVSADAQGRIVDEHFVELPKPYVVRRAGDHPGSVALTFDDGPDPEWTPQILKILRERKVPGTFFVIGQNALANRALLNQIVDEGHELGNHTFTHPNLAIVTPQQALLELNVSQRLVQAYTGRSLRLFRAPYFSDAEATTADELGAALVAQNQGYINVGLHVDPHDWQGGDAADIARSTIEQIEGAGGDDTRQIILLHDGGGDRSETVAALPLIIDRLRAHGYRFVGVSHLAGLTRAQTMPAVPAAQFVAVQADIGLFMLLAGLGDLLKWMFYIAILVGVARAVLITGLAIWHYDLARHRRRPEIDPAMLVSVLIPAHNEERVIEATIRQVLGSRDARIEIIVIDDGSTDATAQIVRNAFAGNPAVRLVSAENGGKAKALNLATELARGEVLIALDADTLFGVDTIARLGRWFVDPRIGAVAGNVKVGNRVNLVTRWQSIEYIASQNLERRALALLDGILVVPGAVGAIRREALIQAGGYPEETLAEDQDMTIQIQRDGWKVIYDAAAMAWTEAPETLASLARQRFRWAFGTLQCLWKHRSILWSGRPAGLAYVGIPQTWLFQIVFSLIAPVIDLFLILNIASTAVQLWQHGWGVMHQAVLTMGLYWLGFTAVDVLSGFAAYRMEPRRERFPMLLLVAQRLVYRQLMYWVMIRAIVTALRGPPVRWSTPKRIGGLGTKRRSLFERYRMRVGSQ